MDSAIARQLASLNRRFYADHASAFARRRSTPQPGVQRSLALIPAGARVFEIGCGDGKAARLLVANSKVAAYLGLDLSPALLDRARSGMTDDDGPRMTEESFSSVLRPPSFVLCDLTSPDWTQVLPRQPFTHILAFSVFHHLPGFAARAQILQALADHLVSGGTLVMSNWQFTRSERLKRRIVPWSAINLTESDVEPNDYLLAWERNHQRGLRYVHLLAEAEARQMAGIARLAVAEIFPSDGVTNDLADYVLMRKSE